MAPIRNRQQIWGYFVNSASETEVDSEDDGSDDDHDEALDLNDIAASSSGIVARSSTSKLKTMCFHLYNTNETVRVRGRFPMADPWWAARMSVTTHNDLRVLCGNAAFYLRQDDRVIADNVVPLFLTSCKVESQHLQLFTDALRSCGKTNELTFKTLPGLLKEFAAMSDVNKEVAFVINYQIKDKGDMVTNYAGLELFYEYMPQLLPKKFKSLVEKPKNMTNPEEELQRHKLLVKFQEALTNEPWVFGYKTVLGSRLSLHSCEATLTVYISSGLFDKLSPVQQDALYIYDTLKGCCRRGGHTFMLEETLRCSHKPACMHQFDDWDGAVRFLVQEYIVKLELVGTHQRVYPYKLWKAEQNIALGVRKLFDQHSDDPWPFNVSFESAQFEDIQKDPQQLKAAEMIAAKPVVVISGMGGCGKTHVVSKVFHHVQHQRYVDEEFDQADIDDLTLCNMTDDNDASVVTPPMCQPNAPTPDVPTSDAPRTSPTDDNPRILLCAPTGKVANLLGQRSHMPGYTLHQVMFSNYKWRKNSFDTEWKFSHVEVLIADECSLVSVQTFDTVLSMLFQYASLRRVVLLGDIKQLPSIEPGNFLADMYAALLTVDCSIMLSTNHRSESQLIVENAVRISQRQCPRINWEQRFCQTTIAENTEYLEFDRDSAIRDLLKYQPDLEDHKTSQFISFKRQECDAINELCCRHYGNHSMFENLCGRRRRKFAIGDKVCCTRNVIVTDHLHPGVQRRLCNGEIFFVKGDRLIQDRRGTQRLLVLDDLSSLCEVDMRELQKCQLRHSWARTIHTFQGSEVNTLVYVVGLASCQTWQHVYTAVTRGRNRIILVTRQSDLDIAVFRQPQGRSTSLQEKLCKQLKKWRMTTTAAAESKPIQHANGLASGATGALPCGANTTSPEKGDVNTTSPEKGDVNTTSPEKGDANTTSPEKGDANTTSPEKGDANTHDISGLDTKQQIPKSPAKTPTKRKMLEGEKTSATDSTVSPLKRSFAKLNF